MGQLVKCSVMVQNYGPPLHLFSASPVKQRRCVLLTLQVQVMGDTASCAPFLPAV